MKVRAGKEAEEMKEKVVCGGIGKWFVFCIVAGRSEIDIQRPAKEFDGLVKCTSGRYWHEKW